VGHDHLESLFLQGAVGQGLVIDDFEFVGCDLQLEFQDACDGDFIPHFLVSDFEEIGDEATVVFDQGRACGGQQLETPATLEILKLHIHDEHPEGCTRLGLLEFNQLYVDAVVLFQHGEVGVYRVDFGVLLHHLVQTLTVFELLLQPTHGGGFVDFTGNLDLGLIRINGFFVDYHLNLHGVKVDFVLVVAQQNEFAFHFVLVPDSGGLDFVECLDV